jgi:5-methylcytosine-specific restriction enzyme A
VKHRPRDQRSPAAQEYRRWYRTARWQRRRAAHLAANPLCANCLRHGRVTVATVAHHKEPHRGDPERFWHGELESLCDAAPWRCHSGDAQSQERGGKRRQQIGPDGWPLT